MKMDVNAYLTNKTKHVYFCNLTEEKRITYHDFLAILDVYKYSKEVANLLMEYIYIVKNMQSSLFVGNRSQRYTSKFWKYRTQ